jgi:Flp pilus assembly protein TadG
VAALWTVLTLPVVLALLIVVIEIGHVWTARRQFEQSVQAAALAGVHAWEQSPADVLTPRTIAQAFAEANAVHGMTPIVDDNADPGGINGNATTTGEIVLGAARSLPQGLFEFAPSDVPDGDSNQDGDYAVLVQASITVPPIVSHVLGMEIPQVTISARATARAAGGQPRLIHIVE